MILKKLVALLLTATLVLVSTSGCAKDKKPILDWPTGSKQLTSSSLQHVLVPNHDNYHPIEQIQSYYQSWKDGNHFDESGNRKESPGYVQAFELPEEHKLPWEEQGSKMGAVVVMVPNGTPSELPGDYCVSTDEAMGYGLILAALMDDRELFNNLFRVVDYYDNFNADRINTKGDGWSSDLTSWAIPAKIGQNWFETDTYKNLSPKVQQEWRQDGVKNEPLYKEKTRIKESVILGEKRMEETASGSAMDGELDIAYALYLAHTQWGSNAQVDFIGLAQKRFDAIFTNMVEVYGSLELPTGEVEFYLPTGDYFVEYRDAGSIVARALTRPCDWMPAQIRTYAKASNDHRAVLLLDNLYKQSTGLSNETTGFVPDFAKWVTSEDGKSMTLIPAESHIANEWMTTEFYMNSSRYAFRQSLDYLHYGEEEGLVNAQKILDFMIKTYQFTEESDFENYPPAIHSLDGIPNEEGLWTNAVLNAGLYTTAAISNDPMYQEFINMGWDNLVNHFDSRYDDWDENGLGYDPTHSGYFSDTWRLLAMLTISGNWFTPEVSN
jgi:hypothetical protein